MINHQFSEEFQAQLEERVEEETLKVTSRYEMKMKEAKNDANEKAKSFFFSANKIIFITIEFYRI